MSAHDALLDAFLEVLGTGSFHSRGTTEFFLPQLRVKGIGELAFPLPKAQARELKAIAEAAPYGKGEETVLDEKVRKCWQIDATKFSIKSPKWKGFLEKTVARVREDLGIAGKVSAFPYKLLLYEKGGHFRAHRDTEKLDAMFGTLIIGLPSAHEGGRLFVRHGGREIEIDFSEQAHLHKFQHAAFFADCEHEVEAVRSGYRCCLVYNLRLDEGDPGQLNLNLTAQARSLLPSLEALKKERPGRLSAVLLEHQYTEANLSLRKLKGNDPARAHALLAAAKDAGFIAHLALVTYHQMGELEEGYSMHYGDEPEGGCMGEIYEEDLCIEHWRSPRDRRVALGTYRIEDDDLISSENLGDEEPDEQEAEGYTGNAGCTMDYWYRRAAVVLWPEEDHELILCQYNFSGACASLVELADGKKTGRGSPFHRMGAAVVANFPEKLPNPGHYNYDPDNNRFALTLKALAAAGSRELLADLLARAPASAFALCSATLWKKLHQVFGIEAFGAVYKSLAAENPEEHRTASFQILDALLARKEAAALAGTIAGSVARLSPKETRRSSWADSYEKPQAPGNREETRILLAASHLLPDSSSRQNALAFLHADSSLLHLREVLAPVLLEKSVEKCFALDGSLASEVLAMAKAELEAEVNRPLEPYADWTRPCPEPETRSGGGAVLKELAAFMADPKAETHEFRRNQGERSEAETFIRRHGLDLNHRTIKRGSPHTLACTKNDHSYHRALACRAADNALLKKLAKLQLRHAARS